MYDDSIFLTMFQHLFGEDFIENPSLREAFTQNKDVNRPIAIIGDSFLNLVVNKTAYWKLKDSEYMDCMRKRFAEKKVNQKTLNRDREFTKFLVGHEFTKSPIGGIGLEKADRFFEAVIGATYVELGCAKAEKFVMTLLKMNEEFYEEFTQQ